MRTPPSNLDHARPLRPVVPLLLVAAVLATSSGGAGAGGRVASPLPGPVAAWSTSVGTDGRVYIADDDGRARQFHGFNIKTDDPAAVTDDLLAAAAERGLDHLRLSVYWDALEPTEGNFDEAYLDEVVAALDRAEDHGILVIVDMHQDVFGPAFGSRGIPAWATRTDGLPFVAQPVWLLNYLQPAVQAAWEHLYEDADLRGYQIRVWTHVVERVADHPALLGYDLLNEPFGKVREGENLFAAAARVEREQLTPMYQRLTDAISAVDPDHWVFIEPPNLASLGIATSLGRVTGPKVAVYPHMYDASIETATYTPDGVVQYDPTFFSKWQGAISTYVAANPMPLMVGEWGVALPEEPGMDQFVRDSLATLDRTGSGWSVFNWCKGGGYCPLDAAGNDRAGIGQIFQPYARAISGAPTASTWDPDTRELTVQFADNAATGPTEIFVPGSRSYPDGWVVEVSDPTGTWTSSFDDTTGVLSVTVTDSGTAHAICVKPAGAAAGCVAAAAPPTTTSTSTTSTTTAATGATTVAVTTPRFTG